MKTKFFLIILSFLMADCSISPPPNPGFRIETRIEAKVGYPPFYYDYIPYAKAGTVTNGRYYAYVPGDPPSTGLVVSFPDTVSNFAGFFDINGGKAPGLWYFNAISGWDLGDITDTCNGQSVFAEVAPGMTTQITCHHNGSFHFPFAPSYITRNDEAVELQATIDGIDTTNGMPIFHFENYVGQLIAITTATQVNGTDVRISSSCLTDKPVGTYTVKVYNAVPAESDKNPAALIGVSSIMIKNQEHIDPCGVDLNRPNCP